MKNSAKVLTWSILFLSLITLLNSCEKDLIDPLKTGYRGGIFIHCEGGFNNSNGSISWYQPDSAFMLNNLFETVNGRPTGDVVQSFSIAGDHGVIIANNSQKIEIVNLETFESTSTLTGFSYPRYFQYAGAGTGYLTNGSFDGNVFEIDVVNGKIKDTIDVGMGPEQMAISGSNLFVANSGGWSFDNTVSVIDIETNVVKETVTVGDIPVSMVSDREGNIWVLCRGKVIYNDTWTEIIDETDSKIVKIDGRTFQVEKEVVIGEKGDGFNPDWINILPDGKTILYGEAGGLFSFKTENPDAAHDLLIDRTFSFAAADPLTGYLLAVEITDYASSGNLFIYNENLDLVSDFKTGIAPGGIVFNW